MSGTMRAATRPLLTPAFCGCALVAALLFLPAVLCSADGAHRWPKVLVIVHASSRDDNPALSALIADSMKAELESRSIDALTSADLVVDDAALAALGEQSHADYAIRGTYAQTGSAIRLEARWINFPDRKETGRASRSGELNLSFDSLVADLVDELVEGQKESIARLPLDVPAAESPPAAAPLSAPVREDAAALPPVVEPPVNEPRLAPLAFSFGSAPFIATFTALNYFPLGLALSLSGHYQVRAPGGLIGFGLASGVSGFHGKGAYSQADFYVIPIGIDLLYGTRTGSRIDFFAYVRGGPAIFMAKLSTGNSLAKVIPFVVGGVGINVLVLDPFGLSLDGSYTCFFDSPDPILGFTPSLSLVVKL
jgi:hypothetical protein